MLTPQLVLGIATKLVVDIFAGGGGWSTAYEQATGQHVHIAINHNPDALSMHEVNHPQTRHYIADVWEVCPRHATGGQAVGWLHLSPDCTDHSQAKGGQPRNRKIRALAWVGVRWAGTVRPDIISLENVVQILKWGRLIAKRDPSTGRVVKLSGGIADPGERVPLENQYLIPDPKDLGRNWQKLVSIWRSMGYTVEWKELNAADYGAGTTRKRLFAIARRDGQPIVWPQATHFKKPGKGQKRWRAAADGIDWSIEGKTIFGRKRPLADATMRRIALGMKRYVLESADPFIVPIANWSRDGTHSVHEPARTMTARPRGGSQAIVTPIVVQAGHGEGKPGARRWSYGHNDPQQPVGTLTASNGGYMVAAPTLIQAGYGEREGQAPRALDIGQPLGVVTAGGIKHALATGFLAQANGGCNATPARDARQPSSTITNTGSQQQLVTAHLATLRRHSVGTAPDEPLSTMAAAGQHHALVEYDLAPEAEAGALRVAAFLMRYYGEGGQWGDLREPAATVTTRDRLALVTVLIRGTPYVIVDIRLRMLTPRELYRLQGFPENYIIALGHDGRIFSKSAQVHMVGNSVSPPPAIAFIACNAPDELLLRRAA